MPLPLYSVKLVERVQLAHNTIQLSFQLEDRDFDFEAGQFVSLRFEYNGKLYKRSYSIANSPEHYRNTGIIQIAIGLIPEGKASECFRNMKLMAQCQLSGPVGILTLVDSLPSRLVLIGTGTGIAPYRAMIPSLKEILKKEEIFIKIIMGIRQRKDLFYDADFKALADQFKHASYEVCFSRENVVNSSIGEHEGYVQNRFESLCVNPEKDIVYLCGNPSMIDDALKILKTIGFTNRQIKREKYTFSR